MQKITLLFLLVFSLTPLLCQDDGHLSFLEPADTFHSTRFWACAGAGAAIYGGASIGLYQAWYKDYDLTGFHTFNDSREWENMDKMGHTFTAYTMSSLSFQGARWTGLNRRKSMWLAAGVGTLLQGTIEMMDGFSEKWGFSWYDIGANTLGVGLFVGQEMAWQEQRFVMKVSNTRPVYPNVFVHPVDGGEPVSVRQRADELYGTSFGETFIKDYNGQTIWLSANLQSFIPGEGPRWLPSWLNLAAGYGANNMFGGFDNQWEGANGESYVLDDGIFPRYRQFYLSLDVDLSRIPTHKRGLRFLLKAMNWIKIPSPTLEVNTLGGVKFRALYW
ncbi:MAG: DUF2279 domain-containing protein [Phaeodactylibacter sp.]|nr:DUF2279 domain-containing protein [Phaeodactylibacter sp.]HQU58863.1 DUF2279 domain-containing protein [Saprospiraceae bacterium]